MPNIYAELSITSRQTNLQDISKITGLPPAREHNINDVTPKGIVLDYSLWSYETSAVETYCTEGVSSQLIMNFKNNIDKFISFIHRNRCEVSICFVIGNTTDVLPALSIDRAMIKFAAEINAEVYFDGLYPNVPDIPNLTLGTQGR
jgi:hypothetical protein